MIELFCDSCNKKIFRSEKSTNKKCNDCGGLVIDITEENKKKFIPNHIFINVICSDCGTKEDDFMPKEENFECINCGGTTYARDINRPEISRFSEKFPYYDRGMGIWLKNQNHRKTEMKKRNLIEAPGDFSVSDMQDKKAIKQAEEDKAIVQKLEKDMKESPAFAEYRQRKNDIKFKHKPGVKNG